MLMVALRVTLAVAMFLLILWLDLGHKERAYLYEVAQQAAQSPKKKKKNGGDTAVLTTTVVQTEPLDEDGLSPWSSIGLAVLVTAASLLPGWAYPTPWALVAYWITVALVLIYAGICAFGHYARIVEGVIGVIVTMAILAIVSWGDGVLSLIPIILSIISVAIVIGVNMVENPNSSRKEDELDEPVGGFILPTLAGFSSVATIILGIIVAVLR